MKKFNPYLAILVAAITIVSCKKDEPSSATNQITGNWKFISIAANTQSTLLSDMGTDTYKSVTISHYTTINNTGTVSITGNSFTGKDIGYSIDDSISSYTYINDELLDSTNMPFSFDLPASSSVSNYQLIGQDSIYFTGGNIVNSSGGSETAMPSGCRFTVEGTTLKLNCRASKDSTINEGSMTGRLTESGVFTMTLEKQ